MQIGWYVLGQVPDVLRLCRVPQHLIVAAGLCLAALGLADRMAFVVSPLGALGLIVGVALLLFAIVRPGPDPGPEPQRNLVFTAIFVLLAVVAAATPHTVDVAASALTVAAALIFIALQGFAAGRRVSLWLVAALLLGAHAALILHLQFPKQDAFRILTYEVDALFRHGVNPYSPIIDPVSPDVKPYLAGYPPGAFLVLAPFRLLLGDIRWGFVAAEGLFVAAFAATAGGAGEIRTWRQAAILLPLVFPRTAQAYYDYGNHDWLLLGITAAAVALRSRWAWCGVLLGIGIVTKQHFAVFPVLFLLPWLDRRSIGIAVVTAALMVLPFALWDGSQMLHSLLATFTVAPDPNRLTLPSMLRVAGFGLSRGGAVALSALGFAAALGCAWLGRRSVSHALLASGVGLAVLTLCWSFAAYNYYGYALGLACLGVALSDWTEGEEARSAPGVVLVAG